MRIAIAVSIMFGFGAARAEEKDNFAAIGFSTKTGEYWFSFGMPTEDEAKAELTKRQKEPLTIVTAKNCFIALARSADGKAFGTGTADTPKEAEEKALKECRKTAKTKTSIVLCIHAGQGVGGDSYSCIAFSVSTGKFAVSVAKASKSEAEADAVLKCGAEDAKVVGTAKKNFCVLALGKDKGAFGIGIADTEKAAQEKAMEECKKKTSECFIAATVSGKK